jgi:hypothetical protein
MDAQVRSGFTRRPRLGSGSGGTSLSVYASGLQLFLVGAPSTLHHSANMAGPSDKARFYLEQSATELNELERKKIFSRVR